MCMCKRYKQIRDLLIKALLHSATCGQKLYRVPLRGPNNTHRKQMNPVRCFRSSFYIYSVCGLEPMSCPLVK